MARNILTSSNKAFKIEGLDLLREQFNGLKDVGRGKKAKAVFLKAGAVLADEIRRQARWNHVKEAVFLSEGPASKANVLVGINFKRAPDVYWLEFGTYKRPARFPKTKRLLRFMINGKWIFVKRVANMIPHPFFRTAVAAKRAEVAEILADGLREIINPATP